MAWAKVSRAGSWPGASGSLPSGETSLRLLCRGRGPLRPTGGGHGVRGGQRQSERGDFQSGPPLRRSREGLRHRAGGDHRGRRPVRGLEDRRSFDRSELQGAVAPRRPVATRHADPRPARRHHLPGHPAAARGRALLRVLLRAPGPGAGRRRGAVQAQGPGHPRPRFRAGRHRQPVPGGEPAAPHRALPASCSKSPAPTSPSSRARSSRPAPSTTSCGASSGIRCRRSWLRNAAGTGSSRGIPTRACRP